MSNITVREIHTWLANARAGEAITYFRGSLALAREEGGEMPGEANTRHLIEVADYLWKAAQHGRVHLVQIRHGHEDYTYVAVAQGGGYVSHKTVTFAPDTVEPPS